MDQFKVNAIKSWLTPTNVIKVRDFHNLDSFYIRFNKTFINRIALIIECLKKGTFEWFKAPQSTLGC